MKKNMEGNKQYKRVPFTIELAKKVQSGEITGRIIQNNGLPATVLAFDINGKNLAVRFTRKDGTEAVSEHQPNGKVLAEWCSGSEDFALVIELLEETPKHEFKVGDKIRIVYPKEQLSEMMSNGCYQGKVLTINQVTNYCVRASSNEVKEDCFTFDEIEPYEPKHEFKPFDKVLVRDNNGEKWVPDMFRYYDDNYPKDYPYRCCANDYKQCIHYAGNEHLLGTSNNPK
jgi:hypothetical protein